MNERPIPEAAYEDENSVEMLRIWIAGKELHCSLKIGMYKETTKISEEKAWGRMLADASKHIANALKEKYSTDAKQSLRLIQDSFNKEMDAPTANAKGHFTKKH